MTDKLDLNQQEIRDLKEYGVDINKLEKPNNQKGISLIIISKGRRKLHDSGYPFIRVFGIFEGGTLDLGWHDHIVFNVPINIDSYGKNLFHVMSWMGESKFAVKGLCWTSSLIVGESNFKQNNLNENLIYVS